ncbi:MAG: BatA domain-containing protein [Planctomycetia bacterium]|nr:MAG: hypothetical protein EDS66_05265 [Planctomycetota bacterium]KAB2949425.1 MAG: hypothetical protein F9K17_03015 [Phycisphaerae bacterium]MBE7458370.1 BatA domain-containing protein [Planctomycetia bacterium]MCK6465185.1 BatA domain-containing protein [Phycisphaerae bacterium]MCQ3920896.1 hypothetical protein [Planctomycetota bacterium]
MTTRIDDNVLSVLGNPLSAITASPLLGAFVWPALFSAGAACVAIPVLIHILARRRYRRVRWAAIEFLLEAQRRNQRRVQLEELILLALRCLAVFCVAMFVSRYFIPPEGVGGALARAARVEHILILDDSLSTGYRVDEATTVFDRARRSVIAALRTADPEIDAATVILPSRLDDPLVASVTPSPDQIETVEARLATLAPTQETYDAGAVIAAVREFLDTRPDALNVVLHVVSDFQANAWIDRSRSGADGREGAATRRTEAGIFHALRDWAGSERSLRVVCVNVGSPQAVNRGVHDPAILSGIPVVGTEVRVKSSVFSVGAGAEEATELTATIGEALTFTQAIGAISAGSSLTAETEVAFPSAGEESVRLSLPSDRLEADDAAYLAARVFNAVRILIVNGEPDSDPFLDEVHLLATALRPSGNVFSGYEATIVSASEFEETRLTDFHAVILANVPSISDRAAQELTEQVRGGGGLILFLGDQVDEDAYNRLFFAEGGGILPARLGEREIAADAPRGLLLTDRLHPALSRLAREGDPLGLGRVRFRGFTSCSIEAPDPGSEEDANDAEAASISGAVAKVLATYDDDARSPAIVEKRHGEGRVVLVTSSADKEWNNWADFPTYLPICLELAAYVTERAGEVRTARTGGPVEWALPADRYEAAGFVRTPAYPAQSEVSLTGAPTPDGRSIRFRLPRAESPGIYRLSVNSREAREETFLAAANVDPRESDLRPCREEELRRTFDGVPMQYVTGAQAENDEPPARRELWSFFVIAAALTLMLEQTLAWWFGRRHRATPAVAGSVR